MNVVLSKILKEYEEKHVSDVLPGDLCVINENSYIVKQGPTISYVNTYEVSISSYNLDVLTLKYLGAKFYRKIPFKIEDIVSPNYITTPVHNSIPMYRVEVDIPYEHCKKKFKLTLEEVV